MGLDTIKKEISAGKIYPVYLLHGEESFLIDEAASYLENHLLQEHEKVFDLQVLYGMDVTVPYLLEQLLQLPLMASRRLIMLREAQQLPAIKDLENYLSKPAPSSILVLCHKGKLMDKRIKAFDAIRKHGFILEASRPKERDIGPWLVHTAKAMKIILEPEAAEALTELIGYDLSLLNTELKKLAVSHANGAAVSRTDIFDLVGMSREFNILELQNALESGNVLKTMQIAMRLTDQKGYSIIPLIGLLSAHFTRVYAVKSLGNAPDAVVGDVIGNKSPFVIKKAREAARKFSLQTLEHYIGWLHIYDLKSKGWNYRGGDDKTLTIELLDKLLFPREVPDYIFL